MSDTAPRVERPHDDDVRRLRVVNAIVALSLLGFAVLAWGAILLVPSAVFWDDWIIVNDDTLAWARDSGLPWIGYVHGALAAIGMWTFKVVAILCSALTGWFAYLIAGRGLGLTVAERWALAALVVVLPLNVTRDIAILSTYSWSLTLFMAAWWLLSRAGSGARWYPAALASVGLLVSYTTASLLPFTGLIIAHLAFVELPRVRPIAGIPRFLARRWYLFVAPAAFWVLRSTVLTPTGLYDSYNQVGGALSGLPLQATIAAIVATAVTGAILLWRVLARVPSAPRRDGIASLALSVIVALGAYALYTHRASGEFVAIVLPAALAVAAAVIAIGAITRIITTDGSAATAPLVGIAIAAVALGVLPYLLVGKPPSYAVFESRHQLLMPIGVAVVGVAAFRVISRLVPRILARLAIAVVIAGFAGTSALATLGLVADAHKQEQIVAALAADDVVRYSGTIVFVDHAQALGYDFRTYDFYELTGWLSQAHGDHTRLGLRAADIEAYTSGEFDGLLPWATRYGFGEWTPGDPRLALVTIEQTRPAQFWELVLGAQVITISTQPLLDLQGIPAG